VLLLLLGAVLHDRVQAEQVDMDSGRADMPAPDWQTAAS